MKKIMFNDRCGLTDAVLEGRKTMTRRIIPRKAVANLIIPGDDFFPNCPCVGLMKVSRFKVGEIIAVAQSYKDAGYAHDAFIEKRPGWRNKMFVGAEFMPHRIRITDVRIEMLQNISDEDCFKEGIMQSFDAYFYQGHTQHFKSPKEAFAGLIDKVSGKGIWESNPYVFVYSFELVK